MLKDALVTDLDRILTGLTDRQIQAQAQGSQDLAKQFIQSLTVGLQGPLERIAETFQQTSQGNSQAVTGLLTDVLAGFSQRLEELFGGQITGINQLQQQTIQALQAAVTKLDQMASTVEAAGTRTSETMGQKLADAIGGMEARQNIMNERMTEFVEQMRNLIRDSQSETNQKLQATLKEIGEAVRAQISAPLSNRVTRRRHRIPSGRGGLPRKRRKCCDNLGRRSMRPSVRYGHNPNRRRQLSLSVSNV